MELRNDGRKSDQLRPITMELGFVDTPLASVLYKQGSTIVLAAMDVTEGVPYHVKGTGAGWLTAEYAMLPGSTPQRKKRSLLGDLFCSSCALRALDSPGRGYMPTTLPAAHNRLPYHPPT